MWAVRTGARAGQSEKQVKASTLKEGRQGNKNKQLPAAHQASLLFIQETQLPRLLYIPNLHLHVLSPIDIRLVHLYFIISFVTTSITRPKDQSSCKIHKRLTQTRILYDKHGCLPKRRPDLTRDSRQVTCSQVRP
jgi:hypothetical protein